MTGCLAPSEIPGLSTDEARIFGQLAEDLISSEFRSRRSYSAFEIFIDNNNPASYLFFLVKHNPRFSEQIQRDFYTRLYSSKTYRVPDMLIHTMAEHAFYEIKPDSVSGRRAGRDKVAILTQTYGSYGLPYRPGIAYRPAEITVASFAGQLSVKLKTESAQPGLIVYRLCLDSEVTMDLVTLATLLRYIVRKLNEQQGKPSFRPVDLQPAFAREGELASLARTLGLTMATAAAGVVGWKFFWKAVAQRFAARGATAALLAAADGPLPVGELIAAGMAVWTVVDIIRFSDALWIDAARIAQNTRA